jgi:hypothetical protein
MQLTPHPPRAANSPRRSCTQVEPKTTPAYFCDGRNVESWFRGSVTEDEISAKSKGSATLEAKLDGSHIKGTVQIKSEKLKFEINEAKKPAGLYRARGSKTTIGWIVLEDGSQVGVQTAGADSTAAPELKPREPAGHC